MIVWTEGRFVAADAPVFAANDRGAILGDGVFETVRTVGARAVFLDAHLDRMGRAAAALRLAWDAGGARAGAEAVLGRAAGADARSGALRLTLTRGAGGRGLTPIPLAEQRPRLVATWSLAGLPGDAPVRLAVSRVRRHGSAPSCRHKTLSYADAAAARAEAAEAGADDAVMLGASGRAACTSIANLWALTPRGFVTPPLSEGALAGIVRQRLLCAGAADGVPVRVGAITRADLFGCPLYRSNSLVGVQRCQLAGGAAPSPDNPLGLLYERLEREALGA